MCCMQTARLNVAVFAQPCTSHGRRRRQYTSDDDNIVDLDRADDCFNDDDETKKQYCVISNYIALIVRKYRHRRR